MKFSMYLRRTVRLKSEVSFDEPLNTDFEGNELLLSDILGTSGGQRLRGHRIECGKGIVEGCFEKAVRTGAENHVSALRTERRRRDDAKGRGGFAGNFTKLYFEAGKEDYSTSQERNFKNGINVFIKTEKNR